MNRIRLLLASAAVLFLIAACGGGTAPQVGVDIEAQTTTMAIDGRTQLSANVTNANNTAVTWSTSNPAIATVDSNGIVEANGVAGTVDITATSVADPTKSDTVTITVGDFSIDSVTITTPSNSVQVGSTLDLSAAVSPASAPQEVIWSSSDQSVATVSSTGVVTGVAAGTATITAKSAADIDVSDSVEVTVFAAGGGDVTAVVIESPSTEVQVGGEIELNADVTPSSAPQTVVWSSSNDAIATVDSGGTVTGISGGNVTITATSTADPNVSDDIAITVLDGSVTSVTITNAPSNGQVPEGTTVDLGALVQGTGSFSQDVFWTSSAPTVATVDAAGVVTGVSTGTTTITATAASDVNVSGSVQIDVVAISVDCSSPTELTSSTTGTLAVGCYRMSSSVSLTAPLTLQAGTVVEAAQSVLLDVAAGGSLNAQGTPTQPIIFRGLNQAPGFWEGIRVASTDTANVLDFVTVSDAGACCTYAGIRVDDFGTLSLTNSTVSNSSANGLYVEDNGRLTAFTNNNFENNSVPVSLPASALGSMDGASTFSGNTESFIDVRGGTITAAQNWPNTATPFRFVGNVTLDAAVTVEPGAEFVFDSGYLLVVDTGGSLNAVGTSTAGITFRGEQNSAGFWEGISIKSNSAENVFDFVTVSDAGVCCIYANVYVDDGGRLSLTNSTVSNSSGTGLYVENTGNLAGFGSNTFTSNNIPISLPPNEMGEIDAATSFSGNTANFVDVRNGTVTTPQTWANTAVPFRLVGNVTVTSAVTAALGSDFRAGSGVVLTIDTGGSLNADADPNNDDVIAAGDAITFAGENPSAGFWEGIYVKSGSDSNVLNGVTVSHGGACCTYANIRVTSSGKLLLRNSFILDSSATGLFVDGTVLVEEGGAAVTTEAEVTAVNTFIGNADATNLP